MVPGPAGEGGRVGKRHSSQITVSDHLLCFICTSLLVSFSICNSWSDGEALVELYLLCHPQSSLATSGDCTHSKGLLKVSMSDIIYIHPVYTMSCTTT